MTIQITQDQSRKLTTFTATGAVSLDDLVKAARSYYEGRPTKNALWDFSKATMEINTGQVHQITNIMKEYGKKYSQARKGGKTAAVASRDLEFGLSRMDESPAGKMPYRLMVFRNIEAAHLWLDSDEKAEKIKA